MRMILSIARFSLERVTSNMDTRRGEELPHLTNDFDVTFWGTKEANFYKWCPFNVCCFGTHVVSVKG